MKLTRKGKISFLEPEWSRRNALVTGFSCRNGGVSRPPYNSLNLGFNTDDPRPQVEANRATLTRSLGLAPQRLLTVQQEHGTNILLVNEPNPDVSHFQHLACDAIVTDQPGIMIGVLVADCFPVLLFDPGHRAIAAVHIGWRGAAAGLLEQVVRALESEFKADPRSLWAAIGPGIGAHSYEVDRPVRDAYREGAGHWDQVAEEVGLGKWRLDLRASCRLQLEAAGVSPRRIEAVEQCTCCHKEMFFSHRRDQGITGRQIGFILLPEE